MAIARRFAHGRARVLLVARTRNELDESRAELLELPSEVHAVVLDLTFSDSARQLVAKASELWGGLDILVTNAGEAAQGGFLELDEDAWQAGFGLKMFANLRVNRHAWPLLKQYQGIW